MAEARRASDGKTNSEDARAEPNSLLDEVFDELCYGFESSDEQL